MNTKRRPIRRHKVGYVLDCTNALATEGACMLPCHLFNAFDNGDMLDLLLEVIDSCLWVA